MTAPDIIRVPAYNNQTMALESGFLTVGEQSGYETGPSLLLNYYRKDEEPRGREAILEIQLNATKAKELICLLEDRLAHHLTRQSQ